MRSPGTQVTEAEFTAVATGIHLGGLVVDGDTVWYSDVIGGGVYRVAVDGAVSAWLPERRWVAGLLVNEDGAVLVSGPGGIVWLDPATGRSGTLVGEVNGEPLPGVNEMCPDGRGGLYFGTVDLPAIENGERPGATGLYRLDVDGNVRQLCGGLVFTNGIEISPDGGTLYHNESFVGTFAYAIGPAGDLGERRLVIAKEDCDGIALDTDGNLWISGFFSHEILCVTPAGDVLRRLSLPGGGMSNVCFGGDGRYLYATATAPGASEELRAGRIPTERNSVLYRVESRVTGRVVTRTRFRLT